MTYMNPVPKIPKLTKDGAATRDLMRNVSESSLAHRGSSVVEVLPTFLDVWNKYVLPGALTTAWVTRVLATALIPQSLSSDDIGINKLMDFIKTIRKLGFDPRNFYCLVDTPFVVNGGTKLKVRNSTRPTASVQPA